MRDSERFARERRGGCLRVRNKMNLVARLCENDPD